MLEEEIVEEFFGTLTEEEKELFLQAEKMIRLVQVYKSFRLEMQRKGGK